MVLKGKVVSEGVAVGEILFIGENRQTVKKYIEDTEAELEKLEMAVNKAIDDLDKLKSRTTAKDNKEIALILDAHSMLLRDEEYMGQIKELIKSEKICAQWAINRVCDKYVTAFQAMDNEYMHARALDIKDISKKMLQFLDEEKYEEFMAEKDKAYIIVAEELTPSDTLKLDSDKILAFVTHKGSVNSHVSIVAKTMGVPALVGVDISYIKENDVKCAIVDTNDSWMIINPDEALLNKYQKLVINESNSLRIGNPETSENGDLVELNKIKHTICEINGKQILVGANIGSLKECQRALDAGCDAIGLVRSEFLYMKGEVAPCEEEQFKVYRSILTAMKEKPVVIRTLDIGADKKLPYIESEEEDNPALGIRGVRLSLNNTELFRTQLRALLRASVYGNLTIMYPMISSVNEVRKVKAIVSSVEQELHDEKIQTGKFNHAIMIETPAAAINSDVLAKEVDFFSVGTNDLTQYTYACDRQNDRAWDFIDEDFSAVVELIRIAATNAHKNNIKIGVCGELAANERFTEKLVEIGVDELSVVPSKILNIKSNLRSI